MLKYILLTAISINAQITITLNKDTLTALPRNQVVSLTYKADFNQLSDYITIQLENTTIKVPTKTKVQSWNSFETNVLIPDTKEDSLKITIKEYRKDNTYSHLPTTKTYPVCSLPLSIRKMTQPTPSTTTKFNILGRPYGTSNHQRWDILLGK